MLELNPSSVLDIWQNQIADRLNLPSQVCVNPKAEGYATELFFVESADGAWVVRFYPRKIRLKTEGYVRSSRLLADLGAFVPMILGYGDYESWSWVVEKKINGTNIWDCSHPDRATEEAARSLAWLHGHERLRHGRLGTWGGFNLSQKWRQQFDRRWAKVIRLFPELDSSTHDVEEWFIDWTDSFVPSQYQLLHGDYHPGNVIVTPDWRIAFLDFRTPRYGFGLLEMVEAAHHFGGEEPQDWTHFVPVYLEYRGSEVTGHYEHFATSLHAVFHLRHVDRFADLAVGHKGTLEDRRRWERNSLDSWKRFCALSGVVSPDLPLPSESPFPNRLLRSRQTV